MEASTKSSQKFDKQAKANKETRRNRASGSSVPRKTRRNGPTTKDVLGAAAKTNFTSEHDAKKWETEYKETWTNKKTGSDILHLLAKKDEWPPDMAWKDQQIKDFLNWTLERHHKLLEVKNKDRYTPLHLAIMCGNNAFVEAVLSNKKLVNLGAVLSDTCQYGNSLHVAVKYKLLPMSLMVEKCAQFVKMFSQKQPDDENTPLHSCMSMDLNEEEWDEEGSESEEGSDDDDDEDDDDYTQSSYQDLDGDGGIDDNILQDDNNAMGHRKASIVDNPSLVSAQHRALPSLLQRTMSLPIPPAQESNMKPVKVVELLIQRHDSVLCLTNKAKRTPYQERVFHLLQLKKNKTLLDSLKSKPESLEAIKRQIIADDPVAAYIRSYCVRNKEFTRDMVMKALYHPGQERHIEFDLGGLPHATISEDYLNRLAKHLQFESILKYVALPKLTLETTIRRKRGEEPTERRGVSHLVPVFQWLRNNHVEKIVRVMVIDDADPSHCDESIEQALCGFGIEIWDWKRLDLNSDVIWRATTNSKNKDVSVVREVSLYSSGNKSVLMGWASSEGLTNKTKFPDLVKVNLFIREGLEDKRRLNKYIEDFKDSFRRNTGDRVEVHHFLDNKDVSYASELKSSGGSSQPANLWIDCVTDFARLLRRAPAASTAPPVKVAIIDDGVDASLVSLDGKIAIGKSFCPYANSTDLMSSYYVPSGNHGTCMATLICKMCPKVSLYVARLDERQAPGSSDRQITAKSAAEAIRWATESGVDIISMSWTIEKPLLGNEDMQNLQNAVHEAADQNILMFCSTSDQGSSTKDECYPGNFRGCIKIGGATETGEALAWVDEDKVEFLLPGKNVAFHDGKTVSYESGSSVATAAASALAGLLMFSTWLLKKDDEYLKRQGSMQKAFKTLSSGSKLNKFPFVRDYFDTRFKETLRSSNESENHSDKPDQATSSYNLQTMEWDDKCNVALRHILSIITDKYQTAEYHTT